MSCTSLLELLSPDLLFNVLRESTENLLRRRWPGLVYDLFVPCPFIDGNGIRCQGVFPLRGLVRRRELDRSTCSCLLCAEDFGLAELLTGFATPDSSFTPILDVMLHQLISVANEVQRIAAVSADSAAMIRQILLAVSSEITDCPRLFTITRDDRTLRRKVRVDREYFRITLWCEHADHWHPWSPASYTFGHTKEWFARISPYSVLVLKALRLVAPVVGPLTELALSTEQVNAARKELDLAAALGQDIPVVDPGIEYDLETMSGDSRRLVPAEGSALRAFRAMLFDQDHARRFGDLRRVLAPSGEFLWVCPEHYSSYDPGLPTIPDA